MLSKWIQGIHHQPGTGRALLQNNNCTNITACVHEIDYLGMYMAIWVLYAFVERVLGGRLVECGQHTPVCLTPALACGSSVFKYAAAVTTGLFN
jgi:hypothetical protein